MGFELVDTCSTHELHLDISQMEFACDTLLSTGGGYDAAPPLGGERGSCSTPPLGVPLYKFRTNDDWHVTSEECQWALDALQRSDEDAWPGWFADFIEALRRGAGNDGLRVR